MNARFLLATIAFLALVPFLPGAAEVTTTTATAPSNALRKSDAHATDNSFAQRVVLYEEELGNPRGRRADGSVVWSTETAPSDTASTPELALRADIAIPDRKLEMTWRLRRTPGLSTSHSMEFLFKLPPDFPSGSILNVPGFWMKQGERTQAIPLTGLAVEVAPGDFLIGLSAAPADRERNLQLLKDRPWFDIPIVYTNNRRAIIMVEKGTPGEQAFQQAFAAWNE